MNKGKLEITNDTRIIRHKLPARLSHWFLVISFFLTMFTGVAFFFPDFAWLTEILGTPQLARAIHPFTGILMFIAFVFLCSLYWHHNIPEKNDIRWMKGVLEVLKGNEHAVADNGKYNLGQKMLFWTLILAMFTLMASGIIMWRQYFSHHFSIPVLRIAILLHSACAFMLFTGILVHMYMAFWVKGSITGIVEGWVTVRWAKKHHPKWFREEVLPVLEQDVEREEKGESTKAVFKKFS
ncbi:formate dehydrogenase subunit gamma [Aggregatibacter aphrophilus]|uniref:formate dehydrogenase subunit gamma n=1 Tax=Aggregatibacter aphrophilus TaxID=732 RepID=UPI000DA357B9|nr:formate dehydrogenase subunit gamma [Aggregatibacter aphrophilus]RDE93115.1 formate dehydrogenase subunit gamma [Aggregatibacter aphrophilus]SQI97977.1 Formate dehydrogenase-N subunit gamma [Aggregatibacter aphrophilus]